MDTATRAMATAAMVATDMEAMVEMATVMAARATEDMVAMEDTEATDMAMAATDVCKLLILSCINFYVL